jgi:uncharacterized damage-inducible protein DinB
MITAIELIKQQLASAREVFQGTVADITEDQLHKDPGAKALPLGATYAHLIFSEDIIIHSMMQGKEPLFSTTYKEKTGANKSMPPMDEKWSEAHEAWAKVVSINLKQLHDYEQTVYKATDAYVNTLSNDDLEKEIDLGSWGKKTIADLLSNFIIGHTNSLAGEISVLKGIQGSKGYPF